MPQGDEMTAVDADEPAGAPALLQGRQGDADEVAALRGVESGVVALGLDVGDVVDGDEAGHPAEFDGYLVGVGFVDGDRRGRGRGRLAELGGPADRLGEAFPAYGFEDVVDGLEVEGLDGEALVRGDEDDQRGPGEAGEEAGEVEAVESGHLDVEEDDVDRLGPVGPGLQGAVDPAQCLGGVVRALGAADPWIRVQQVQQLLQGGFLVIDGEGAQHERGV